MSELIKSIEAPVRLSYMVEAGIRNSRFLQAVQEGRLLGERCPDTGRVYFPPRGISPTCGEPMLEQVEVADHGVVSTFCLINFPFEGQLLEPPYACAHIILDGADTPLLHIVGGCPVEDVRMGMRVKAVWKPREEREATLENIRYFEPTGEADAPFESYAEHL